MDIIQFKVTNEIEIISTDQFTIRQEQFKNYIYFRRKKDRINMN